MMQDNNLIEEKTQDEDLTLNTNNTCDLDKENKDVTANTKTEIPYQENKKEPLIPSEALDSSERLDDILNQTAKINQQLAEFHQHKMIKAYNSIPHLLWFNLLKGTAFGLGSVLGATVVLSVVVYLLSQIEFIPFIGEWVSAILEVVKAPASD